MPFIVFSGIFPRERAPGARDLISPAPQREGDAPGGNSSATTPRLRDRHTYTAM